MSGWAHTGTASAMITTMVPAAVNLLRGIGRRKLNVALLRNNVQRQVVGDEGKLELHDVATVYSERAERDTRFKDLVASYLDARVAHQWQRQLIGAQVYLRELCVRFKVQTEV